MTVTGHESPVKFIALLFLLPQWYMKQVVMLRTIRLLFFYI